MLKILFGAILGGGAVLVTMSGILVARERRARKRRRAWWQVEELRGETKYTCSNCGGGVTLPNDSPEPDRCPNCGSEMVVIYE